MINMSTPHRMTFEATMTGLHQKVLNIMSTPQFDKTLFETKMTYMTCICVFGIWLTVSIESIIDSTKASFPLNKFPRYPL